MPFKSVQARGMLAACAAVFYAAPKDDMYQSSGCSTWLGYNMSDAAAAMLMNNARRTTPLPVSATAANQHKSVTSIVSGKAQLPNCHDGAYCTANHHTSRCSRVVSYLKG